MGKDRTSMNIKGLIGCIAFLSVLFVPPCIVDGYDGDVPFALTISEPGGLKVRIGNGNLTLSWTAPELGAATMLGYNLYRALGDDAFELLITLPQTELSYKDNGLENGAVHSYRVTAFNLLEESDPSPIVQGSPDGTPPKLSIDSPSNEAFVPSATVIVRWTAEDKGSGISRFEVSLDNTPFSDNGQGTSIELEQLENGEHTIAVKAFDTAENQRTATVNFTVDTAPPILRMLAPYEDEVLSGQEVTVSWAAEDAHGRIKGFTYRFDSGREIDLGPNVQSKELVALDGRHTVDLECKDMAGNSANVTVNFTIDLEYPQLIILAPSDGSYLNTSSVLCTWYAVDSATNVACKARMDWGQPLSVPGGDNITFHDLEEGWHKLDVTAEDGAGRKVEAGSRFMVDTITPTIEVTGPDLERPVATNEPMVTWKVGESGSGTRYCYISVDEGPFRRSERLDSGKVRLLGDGPHNISVMVEDRSGNRGVTDIILVLDTRPPQVISVGPRGEDLDTLENVWVLFDEEIDPLTIEVSAPGIRGFSDLVGGNNATFVVLDRPLFGDEYLVDIRASDLAGNPSGEVSWSFSLTDEGRVIGRVFDDDGKDIGGALVVLDDGSSYVCREDGSFDIGVGMGERTFYFTASGHQRYRRTVLIEPASTTELGTITLKGDEKGNDGPLDRILKDPMSIFLVVLFVIITPLAVLNLLGWLKDRGILMKKRRPPIQPSHTDPRPFREDEHRARKGTTFRSGRR
jgi:hypothetical protein